MMMIIIIIIIIITLQEYMYNTATDKIIRFFTLRVFVLGKNAFKRCYSVFHSGDLDLLTCKVRVFAEQWSFI